MKKAFTTELWLLPPIIAGCEQTATFVKELTAIDNALTVVCDREREEVKRALLVDIAERRGYERSVSRSVFGSKKVFDRRKGQAVILIARMLDLI